MGKTKTAFVGEIGKDKKSSAEKYAEKKARREAENSELVKEPQAKSQESKVKKQAPRSKNYLDSKNKIAGGSSYKPTEAIKLVKDLSYTKFDGTLEFHATVKKQGLSVQITLPNSFGKTKKIVVADDKVIAELEKGKIDFDVLLTTAEMMPKLVKFAKVLGPKGLMPNPKNGTIIQKTSDADKFSTATKTIKTEKEQPLIHTSFGKVSQKNEELVSNLDTIISALGGPKQIVKAVICASMSPSVKLEI